MIITSCSFIAINSDSGIAIKASDMNTLMIHLLSRPSIFEGETLFSLCLPGIADDGSLHFYCNFVNPNLGILFAGIHKEDREDYPEKAAIIFKSLTDLKFIELIQKAITEQYNTESEHIPTSTSLSYLRVLQIC
jgi:hypothetical protein